MKEIAHDSATEEHARRRLERQLAVPPLGDLVAVPERDVVYISASSGSTGVPTASPFTALDFDDWIDYEARQFWSPSERLLLILRQFQATAMWTTPSYAWYLGETASKEGIDPRRDLAVRRIFVAGEPGGSIPETRTRIEELWGASVYDYYGLSDIFGSCAGMCEEKDGLHWAEDHILVEVLDPATGDPVAEGERGELVLTTLRKSARQPPGRVVWRVTRPHNASRETLGRAAGCPWSAVPPVTVGDRQPSAARRRMERQVKPNRSIPPPTVIPVLFYPDVREAVAWLSAAFGFAERTRIGESHRAQMSIGADGAMIVAEVRGEQQAPQEGIVTQVMKVRVDNAGAWYERARAHGARVLEPPADREYGERECTVEDLAGHRWQFTETLRDVAPESYGCQTVAPWPGR